MFSNLFFICPHTIFFINTYLTKWIWEITIFWNIIGAQKPQGDSNMAGLKRHNQDYEDPAKTGDTLVILEHEEWTLDRKRQAFCILTYSATSNGMLLQWNTSQEGNMFK